MSENVKIKINEYDKTSPAGSGIDSTDIAFIPGFSALATAPQNIPTLVTSTREFEQLFGTKPRVLTSRDVANYDGYGFKAGDYDKSYVYAKELLFQGMPVVYSNIFNNDYYTSATIYDDEGEGNFLKFYDADGTIKQDSSLSCTKDNNIIELTASKDIPDTSIYVGVTTNVTISGMKNSTPTITTFEPNIKVIKVDNLANTVDIPVLNVHVSDTVYSVGTTTKVPCAINKISDIQIEFVNKDSQDIPAMLDVFASFKTSLKKGETIKLELQQFDGAQSVLDGFYSPTKDANGNDRLLINDQWVVPSVEYPADHTIADKSIYSVKYITSGGYPSVISKQAEEDGQLIADKYVAYPCFSANMLAAAAHRGDAVALIDYQLNESERVFSVDPESGSFYSKIHAQFNDVPNAEYGAMMYPWSIYNCGSTLGGLADSTAIEMPASFGYLMCVAKAIKSSPNWLAMAGVTRGLVPGIQKLLVPGNAISNSIAEEMQPKFGVENHRISINTITNIRPYGLTIWGNRTLKPVSNDGTVALNFLNTRNMLSDIKKLLYTTAKSCMFEQNSTDLWIKFKGGIEPLLRRLKAGNGISDYQIIRGATKYNGDPLTKGEIAAVIKIYPMYAVEYFELAVEINDEEVTVS